jgi:hypothetical protein
MSKQCCYVIYTNSYYPPYSDSLSKLPLADMEGQVLVEITRGLTLRLVVQDHSEEATIHRQPTAAGVVDKTKLPELIHEITGPRPGGADHLRQVSLIDAGKNGFSPTLLAKMGQH